jgi:hypothetical protein
MEVEPETSVLECPLREGRDYSGHTFTGEEKQSLIAWMKQEEHGPSEIEDRWPALSRKLLHC